MDTVIPGEGSRRGDRLLDSVEAAQQALQRAASAAFLKGDPMAEQMQAMARSLGAQYDIFCAAKAAQTGLEQSIRAHTDTVASGMSDLVRDVLNAMTAEVGPQLLKASLPTMQMTLRFLRYRTIYWALLAMATLVIVSGMFSYAVGLNHGRSEGEITAHAIQAVMVADPENARDWAILMANNNPAAELSECRKNISTDEYGRRSCSLPVWLDPPKGIAPTQ
jgi:hypothetical protein